MLRISGTVNDSIVDGKGIRFVIFTQGCPHHCPGCHNPQTHDFSGGHDCDINKIFEKIEANPLLDGVTFSGGEPFCQAKELLPLAKKIKNTPLNIWAYSGYTFDELLLIPEAAELLNYIDVLVDGKFIQEQKTLDVPFRGSYNQRVIDVPKSLTSNQIVILD